ncbi:hypothetical protein [Defluviimonas sp. WL0075]|nr:hypothetical protein [Defluviimonas sp. WL0075]
MNKAQLWRLSGFSALFVGIVAALTLAKGGVYLGMHEGDAIHLADIVLRTARGEWPHIDFMTPLGVLSIAPIAAFIPLGFGVGHAILLAQILVAVLVAPFAIRAAATRLRGGLVYAFVGYVLILCLALVHGGDTSTASISMHYNRWAWAVSYVILLQVLIAPRDPLHQGVEGLSLGLGLAALALIKVTYFVAFAPVIAVALIARRWWRAMLVAIVTGLAVALILTLLAGPAFWLAYLSDLITVATSSVREEPGDKFTEVLGGTGYLAVNMALVGVVILVRKAGHMTEGMLLLLLYVPFAYVVYQNYGNDPQWIVLTLICLFTLWPQGGDQRFFGLKLAQWALVVAGVLGGSGYASVHNLVMSPVRHLTLPAKGMRPLLGLESQHDLLANRNRMVALRANVPIDGPEWEVASLAADAEEAKSEAEKKTILPGGEVLADCSLQGGFTTWLAAAASDLERNGYAGKAVVAADLYGAFWLYGDLAPVRGAAPWYYGKVSGLAQADYLLVPLCPVSGTARHAFLDDMEKQGWTATEVLRTPLYILMETTAMVNAGNAKDAK